jgi:hypothetical protein
MRNVLVAAATLVLCATPLQAQQALAEPTAPQVQAKQRPTPAPALYPTTDEVKREVRANEQRLGRETAPIGSQSWLYLVAAIVVGVIIAAVLL